MASKLAHLGPHLSMVEGHYSGIILCRNICNVWILQFLLVQLSYCQCVSSNKGSNEPESNIIEHWRQASTSNESRGAGAMAFSLSCSEGLASIRTQSAWMRKLTCYQEEADPNTAIFKDTRTLVVLRTFVSRSKQSSGCDALHIKEITEEEFSHRTAAATSALPQPAAPSVPNAARSRSPRRTVACHTPLESVREQLDRMKPGELHQVIALAVSRLNSTYVTPQTTLLAQKAELQKEVLKRPWREWPEVLASAIAAWRADAHFDPTDLREVNHTSMDRTSYAVEGSFHEAIDFLFNWPPHVGSCGTFKQTRQCQLDPPSFVANSWYKSGQLCADTREAFDAARLGGPPPYRLPNEATDVFQAEIQFRYCHGDLAPAARIRYQHFLENKTWVAALPPPDLKSWASNSHRFHYVGKLIDYGKPTRKVLGAPEQARRMNPYDMELFDEVLDHEREVELNARELNMSKKNYLMLCDPPEEKPKTQTTHLELGCSPQQYMAAVKHGERQEMRHLLDLEEFRSTSD